MYIEDLRNNHKFTFKANYTSILQKINFKTGDHKV